MGSSDVHDTPSEEQDEDFYSSSLEMLSNGFPPEFFEGFDFGIWRLNLRVAAELAVVDIWISGGDDLGIEEIEESYDVTPHDNRLLAILAKPISLFEQRLMASVDAGHLKAERVGRDFDEKLDPLRTFIRFQSLKGWLLERDYETGDIFDEYNLAEAEISAAIADEVLLLRSISKRGYGEIHRIASQGQAALSGKIDETDSESLLAALKSTIAENECLKKKLNDASLGKLSKVDKPLPMRPRRTMLTIIAALCELARMASQERGTAQRIHKATEELGAPVDDETIRKILKEIPDALETRMK